MSVWYSTWYRVVRIKNHPSAKNRPWATDRTGETGKSSVPGTGFTLFFLPLLSPSIDHRRSISAVLPGSERFAYRSAITPSMGPYRSVSNVVVGVNKGKK
ncbi:hypothetical protein GW17_00039168 [Ensete ventricosum]|nr:hypothetical protein GW17_00039168 [Ensete ventricosum]